jgi:hypothetical protein
MGSLIMTSIIYGEFIFCDREGERDREIPFFDGLHL